MRRLTTPITDSGAFVTAEFGVSAPKRKALRAGGGTPPTSVQASMLVDTGASHTLIGTSVLAPLHLQPRDSFRFHSASTADDAPDECYAYDVSLMLGSLADQNSWRVEVFDVMATDRFNSMGARMVCSGATSWTGCSWSGTGRRAGL